MNNSPAVLKKVSIGLPFNLGNAEWVADETQVRAVWSLYTVLNPQTELGLSQE